MVRIAPALVAFVALGALWAGATCWSIARVFCDSAASEPLRPTPSQWAALRDLHFVVDPQIESGVVTVDRERPYLSRTADRSLLARIGRARPGAFARFHRDVGRALLWALQHGRMEEGRYPIAGMTNDSIEADLRRTLGAGPTAKVVEAMGPLDPDGTFVFTKDHRELLRHLRFEWAIGRESVRSAGPVLVGALALVGGQAAWPQLRVYGKRPFGDSTFFEGDMARILGWPPSPARDQGESDPRLWRLYLEMWPALQAFVQHVRIE